MKRKTQTKRKSKAKIAAQKKHGKIRTTKQFELALNNALGTVGIKF